MTNQRHVGVTDRRGKLSPSVVVVHAKSWLSLPSPPADPAPIEVPDTQAGWEDVTRKLAARMGPDAPAPQLLACEGGEVTVSVTSWDGWYYLEARGLVSLDGGRYLVSGNPWQVDVREAVEGAEPRIVNLDLAAQVAAVVASAWRADGEHARLRELGAAHMAAASCCRCYTYPANGDSRADGLAAGRLALLRLAAVEMKDSARGIAMAWVASGFPGTVAELLVASAAVTTQPVE